MTERQRPARPRPAASLVLLREGGRGLEVLLGRRGGGARFMPGVYVFPGGRATRHDALPWEGEPADAAGQPDPLLRRLARSALRETFEETGLVIGRPHAAGAPSLPRRRPLSPIETAYRAHGMRPALDLLRFIGRAITPAASPIRFDARFFLADGSFAAGEIDAGDELEDLRWHPLAAEPPGPMRRVTKFMLRHAARVWQGEAGAEIPFFTHRLGRIIVGPLRPSVPSPAAVPAEKRRRRTDR